MPGAHRHEIKVFTLRQGAAPIDATVTYLEVCALLALWETLDPNTEYTACRCFCTRVPKEQGPWAASAGIDPCPGMGVHLAPELESTKPGQVQKPYATEEPRRFESLVLQAMSEEMISVSKAAALMSLPLGRFRDRLSLEGKP